MEKLVEEEEEPSQDQNFDSHDRFFALAKMDYQRGTENIGSPMIPITSDRMSFILISCPTIVGKRGSPVSLRTDSEMPSQGNMNPFSV